MYCGNVTLLYIPQGQKAQSNLENLKTRSTAKTKYKKLRKKKVSRHTGYRDLFTKRTEQADKKSRKNNPTKKYRKKIERFHNTVVTTTCLLKEQNKPTKRIGKNPKNKTNRNVSRHSGHRDRSIGFTLGVAPFRSAPRPSEAAKATQQ